MNFIKMKKTITLLLNYVQGIYFVYEVVNYLIKL